MSDDSIPDSAIPVIQRHAATYYGGRVEMARASYARLATWASDQSDEELGRWTGRDVYAIDGLRQQAATDELARRS